MRIAREGITSAIEYYEEGILRGLNVNSPVSVPPLLQYLRNIRINLTKIVMLFLKAGIKLTTRGRIQTVDGSG